jgi:hypothetical protein
LSGAILVVDYLTGPFIQFPILFVFPVTLATVAHGRMVGSTAAVVLPLLRLSFFSHWPLQSSWPVEIVDTGVDAAILVGTSVLLDRMLRQERELRVLQGLLPICSFCKKIRDEAGQWRRLESYIAARSNALFSHTVCPECGPRHYPGLVD